MRSLIAVLSLLLILAGAALYAMEPADSGQASTAGVRPAAMPFKPGSEPAEGLDDIVWGAAVSEYRGLTPGGCNVYGFADLCRYRSSDEDDGVEEVDVDLLFWRDRLFGVELTAHGRKNWAPFRRMVFEEFGGPAEPAAGNVFEWQGQKARAHLSYSYRRSTASLLIVSVEVGDEMGRASGLEQR